MSSNKKEREYFELSSKQQEIFDYIARSWTRARHPEAPEVTEDEVMTFLLVQEYELCNMHRRGRRGAD